MNIEIFAKGERRKRGMQTYLNVFRVLRSHDDDGVTGSIAAPFISIAHKRSALVQFEISFSKRKIHTSLSFPTGQRTMSKPSWYHLSNLLDSYPSTADEVESTIMALRTAYPWIPTQINFPDGPWPKTKPYYVHKSHIITEDENYRISVDNITRTGRILDEEEDKYLRYLLHCPFGWSATSPLHHDDSWVHYIQHRFSHIDNLQPILDDMTWPEEISLFVGDYGSSCPDVLLFANAEAFYFYTFDGDALYRAGNTLKEVYYGIRQRKWTGENETGEMWFLEPDNGEEYDAYDYFPFWRGGVDGRTEVLAYPLLPFIPRWVDSDDDSGYISHLED
jgi:hypothetical protein